MSQVCKWTNPLYYLWSRRTPPTKGGSRGSGNKHFRPWEFSWEFHGNIRYMWIGPNTTHDGGTSARIKTTADQRDGILGHGIQIQWRQPMATHLNDLGNNFCKASKGNSAKAIRKSLRNQWKYWTRVIISTHQYDEPARGCVTDDVSNRWEVH